MLNVKKQLKKRNKGQSLAEYGLILALVACACIGALSILGNQIGAGMNSISGSISGGINTGVGAGGTP